MKICGLFLLLVIAGCTVRVTDFTVISTKNQQATAAYVQGPRSTGSDCVAVVFFPLGTPNLKAAIDNAIEQAGPGFDMLVDGVIYSKNKSFLFGTVCYEVQGTPINSQARKAAGLFDPIRTPPVDPGSDASTALAMGVSANTPTSVATQAPTAATASPAAAFVRPAEAASPAKSVQQAVRAAASPRPLPVSAAAPPLPKPASKCDPDFYYDTTGNKHFKPECFGH